MNYLSFKAKYIVIIIYILLKLILYLLDIIYLFFIYIISSLVTRINK